MVQKGPGTTTAATTTTAAAQVKLQAAAQSTTNYEKISQDPMKHVTTFIEKKIRNLEKRKSKLDGYRRMVEDGKPLDPDQTAAASKYDEVIGSLEFAKDLMKNFEATTIEIMKQQRKTGRREQMAREEADNNRICFVVRASRIMELLHENETMREDFLNGTNGACMVSNLEMDQLVNFYELFIMKSYDTGANILEDASATGNHMYELAEGRSKDIVATTYKDLNSLLGRISDCKYFEELRDTNEVVDIHTQNQNENESVSSESTGEDAAEKEENEEANDESEVPDANANETDVLSPNSTEPVSSPSGFSSDGPLKTEEFLRTGNGAPHTTQADTWQQQQPQPQKPEAGDYMTQDVNYQYTSMQRAYEAQRIQEVLAEVQGPCQFLQESIIDREMGTTPPMMSFTGMDIHQQSPLPTTMSSHTHASLTGPAHLHSSALDSAFQTTQNISPIDQTMIGTQGLSNVQQHLAKDSSAHSPNTVSHQEHLTVDHSLDTIQDPLKQETNYRAVTGQNQSYMSNIPATSATQSDMEYAIGHPPRQQADNLGLGQTTFGGQQQASDSHMSYIQPNNEQSSYSREDIRTTGSAFTVPAGGSHPISQTTEMQNLMQTQSDSPVPHIPLPNEQQSGYRSFQGGEPQQNEAKSVPTQDNALAQDQHGLGGSNDQISSDVGSKDNPESSDQSGSPRQADPNSMHHGDQNPGYNSRNSGQQQHHSGPPHGGRGRGGYNSGYRSGQSNQGGGNYHSQRYNNNYRGGRYNGSYDSIGRPNNNYSGGYQGNQSGGGYRGHQDNYQGYRRGGGMRGGRGNQGRGNPRGGGGGNYNRSRTFRPQHANEQAA